MYDTPLDRPVDPNETARNAARDLNDMRQLFKDNPDIQKEISDVEHELQKLHVQLVDASRQAGMAEVATGVLHNVGNVLNSVNVSATLIAERLQQSRTANLARAAELLRENSERLDAFLSTDPKGRMLIQDPPIAQFLFQSTAAAWLWLVVRHVDVDRAKDVYRFVTGVAEQAAKLCTVNYKEQFIAGTRGYLANDVLARLLLANLQRVGVPREGLWREIANTDSHFYGGSDMGNEGAVHTVKEPAHGEPQSLELTLPPLATVMLRPSQYGFSGSTGRWSASATSSSPARCPTTRG